MFLLKDNMKKNLVIFYPSFEKGGVTKILENLIKYNDNINIHIITSKKFLKKKISTFTNIRVNFPYGKYLKDLIHRLML